MKNLRFMILSFLLLSISGAKAMYNNALHFRANSGSQAYQEPNILGYRLYLSPELSSVFQPEFKNVYHEMFRDAKNFFIGLKPGYTALFRHSSEKPLFFKGAQDWYLGQQGFCAFCSENYNSNRLIPRNNYASDGHTLTNKNIVPSRFGEFEENIVAQIEARLGGRREQKLTYTTIGIDHLWRDAIILTKLIERGFKNIRINLVSTHADLSFSLERAKIFNGNSHDIILDNDLYFNPFGELAQFVRLMSAISLLCYKDVNLEYFLYAHPGTCALDCESDVLININYFYRPEIDNQILSVIKSSFKPGIVLGMICDYYDCLSGNKHVFDYLNNFVMAHRGNCKNAQIYYKDIQGNPMQIINGESLSCVD